jgi:Flp pilus assembly protein TadG
MESKMALKEKGQALVWFALLLPLLAVFAMGVADFMVTSVRVQETIAAADLAAHAGAQEVQLLPDGEIRLNRRAERVAASYFSAQSTKGTLSRVECSLRAGRPACLVTASVLSSGLLLPSRPLEVISIGYLAYGVTRDDQ